MEERTKCSAKLPTAQTSPQYLHVGIEGRHLMIVRYKSVYSYSLGPNNERRLPALGQVAVAMLSKVYD